ncbi:MAG: glycoside hydrolase family 95 protein [Bacteroidales bacterium]
MRIWYDEPAGRWEEALPVGNGRLGAMVYGHPEKEVIQPNESTVYAGQPHRNDNPQAREALPEVRRLLFEGRSEEAQERVDRFFISPVPRACHQILGNLRLDFPGHERAEDYVRDLDLDRALVNVRYAGGVGFHRQVFASFPDQVVSSA